MNNVFTWQLCLLERFSIECRKTNTKVITSTNHSKCKQRNEPIQIRSNSRYVGNLLKGREKSCAQVAIGFGFLFIGQYSGARFFKPISLALSGVQFGL